MSNRGRFIIEGFFSFRKRTSGKRKRFFSRQLAWRKKVFVSKRKKKKEKFHRLFFSVGEIGRRRLFRRKKVFFPPAEEVRGRERKGIIASRYTWRERRGRGRAGIELMEERRIIVLGRLALAHLFPISPRRYHCTLSFPLCYMCGKSGWAHAVVGYCDRRSIKKEKVFLGMYTLFPCSAPDVFGGVFPLLLLHYLCFPLPIFCPFSGVNALPHICCERKKMF